MKAFIFPVAAALLATGCGLSGGFLRDSTTQHNLNYDMKAGFQHLRVVSGESTRGAILCVIPLEQAPYAEAMHELHVAAKLGPNQMVINLREDTTTRAWLFFYCSTALTISGDVVEFGRGEPPHAPPPAPVTVKRPAPIEPPVEMAEVVHGDGLLDPPAEPAPPPAPAEKPQHEEGPFDSFGAATAIEEAGTALGKKCPDGVGRKAWASVTFQPNGSASRVVLEPPVAGTIAGLCMLTQLRSSAHVPPFKGSSVTVRKSFTVK